MKKITGFLMMIATVLFPSGCTDNKADPYPVRVMYTGYIYEHQKNWSRLSTSFRNFREPGTQWDQALKRYSMK